jgi:hypothetical protein
MPMQPSTQVTHIPLKGLMDPSVLFLVKVAALLLSFVYAMMITSSLSRYYYYSNFLSLLYAFF